jgi:hypothetical protein
MDKVSYICPSCSGKLEITRLECCSCGAELSGRFDGCSFCKLDKGELAFAIAFIRCRGNIKELERELGLSYPTVRARLETLVKHLGLEPGGSPAEILGRLEKGEISVNEAVRMIRRKDERR